VLSEWIAPAEAPHVTRVTQHQVRYLARADILESQRFGRAWMGKRDSVKAYAAQKRKRGPKPRLVFLMD
jgi:hypothetical protein